MWQLDFKASFIICYKLGLLLFSDYQCVCLFYRSCFHSLLTSNLCLFSLAVTDLQFSQTLLGRPVPFATAGDCYSAAKCPQVSK